MSALRPPMFNKNGPYGEPMPSSEPENSNQPVANTGNLPQPAIPGGGQQPSLNGPNGINGNGPTVVNTPAASNGPSIPVDPNNPHSPNSIPEVAPPAPQASPYDFFMGSPATPANEQPGKFGLPKVDNPNNRFGLIVGGGVAVILIIVMLMLLMPSKPPKEGLVKVAQAQTETLRICELGKTQTKTKPMRSFASNCSLTVTSDRQQMTAYLAEADIKLEGEVLSLGAKKTSTDRLKAAQSASNYDSTFKEVMAEQLNAQGRTIQTTANAPETTANERKQLARNLDATKLLIKQLNQ